MSYARGTTNYNLPQTQGTDKRDWSDTNAAFAAIDSAIKTAGDTASSASSAASTAQSRADSAYTLASTANTAAGNAATAAATADEKAVTAKNRADSAYTLADSVKNSTEKNNLGNAVSLTLNNTYTCPSDGYVVMAGGAAAETAVVVDIMGATTGTIMTFAITPTAGTGSQLATFVRKGMRLKVTRIDSMASAAFVPLQ